MSGRPEETPANQTTASVPDRPVGVTIELRGDLLLAVTADGAVRVIDRWSELEPYIEGGSR